MKNRKLITIASVLAGAVLFLTIVTLLFTGPRMRVQPSIQAYEDFVAPPPERSVSFDTVAFNPADSDFPEPTNQNLARGQVYYNYYCVFCHGINGDGNGEVGKSYVPRPADLGADSIQNLNFTDLHTRSFNGTGHSPVMERVVPNSHRPYLLGYVKNTF